MIKNIILDMGNVLLDYNPEVCLKEYLDREEDRDIIRKELFQGPEWIQGDLGEIREEEKFEGVSKRVPERLQEQLRQCAQGWDMCMIPIEGAKEFCEYVKSRGYHIYVLSNAGTSFYQYFSRFAAPEYFDGIMVSSEVHMIKPDVRIYQYFLEKYDLNGEECLFIDDRKENVEGAVKAGMQGWVFCNDYDAVCRKYKL